MVEKSPKSNFADVHWPTVRELFRVELRMFLRDRRTVFVALVMPLVLMPIFLLAGSWNEKQRAKRIEKQKFLYAVIGSEAERARELIRAGSLIADEVETKGAETIPTRGRRGAEGLKVELEEKESGDPRKALADRELHVLIETFSTAEVREKGIEIEKPKTKPRQEAAGRSAEGSPAPPPELPLLRLVFAADWDYSQTAATALERRIDAGLEQGRQKALAEAGFAFGREAILPIAENNDLASAGQRTGLQFGKGALFLVLMFLLTGGSVIAADTIAGEKERGSLETLLTSAASRIDIVTAKMLLILAVGVTVALSQVLTFALYAGLRLIDLPESFAVDLSAVAVLWLLLLLVPLAAAVAGVLLLVSAYSKTYKEFQQKFFPVSLLMITPTLAAALPGIELRSAIVLVPISNLSVAVREVLVGKIDWLMLPLAWVISAAAAVFLLKSALDALSAERLITASEIDAADFAGGPALFPRQVLKIFAVMWVVLFLASNNITWLQESIERQLAFNFGVVFLGGSFFAIKRYQLEIKEAFALRPVKPMVWLAVLIGAPSFLITGISVAKFSEKFLPVPREILEAFGNALIPPDLGVAKMFLLLAILPGIVEELTFRGVLLHGLRKRFHPVVLALVVGLIFGLFHFALFRLVSTAFLGAGLTAVTLLTGSVYPAILWHALNNGLALLAGTQGLDLLGLDPWVYPLAAGLTASAFWLLWINRTPYPDLRSPRRR